MVARARFIVASETRTGVPVRRKRFILIFSVVLVFILLLNAQTALALAPDSQGRVVQAIQLVRRARGANAKVDAAQH